VSFERRTIKVFGYLVPRSMRRRQIHEWRDHMDCTRENNERFRRELLSLLRSAAAIAWIMRIAPVMRISLVSLVTAIAVTLLPLPWRPAPTSQTPTSPGTDPGPLWRAIVVVPDRDGDGTPNRQDACPNQAASTPNGCPADTPGATPGPRPSGDRDGDGTPNRQDACPNQAAGTLNGCPADTPGNAPSARTPGDDDRDGDGIPNRQDACPTQPADTANGNGCPADTPGATPDPRTPGDRDGDGTPNRQDTCPTQPADTPNGCPTTTTLVPVSAFASPRTAAPNIRQDPQRWIRSDAQARAAKFSAAAALKQQLNS
jgi:Thrombospondin type 3 repeat